MLTLLLIMTMFGQGQSLVGFGLEFITAFPENVAYFYPFYTANYLNITALYNNTKIMVYYEDNPIYDQILNEGETDHYFLGRNVEAHEFTQSLKSVRVVGSKNIVVVSISVKGDSLQTNVVPSIENLGALYYIPYLNYSTMLSTFYEAPTNVSKSYKHFRLVIINAKGRANNITIIRKQSPSETVVLQPWGLLQLQLNGSEIAVVAYYKVAVIMAHPCFEATPCKCNMVVNQLLPVSQWGQSFVVPFLNNTTWSHVTDKTSMTENTLTAAGNLEPILSGDQYITTTYPVSLRLIRPGFILEVIPESMFSACYLVQFSWNGYVLVIAETASRSEVRIDSDSLLQYVTWTTIANSPYSKGTLHITDKHVIWHPTSKIAVYMFQKMASGTLYGGPAIPLSDKPDGDGCALYPAEYLMVSTPMSWPESHEYCMSMSNELVSPSTEIAQEELADFLLNTLQDTEHWIGLRRSLLTLDWYWQMGEDSVNLNYTQWNDGEPLRSTMGLCASIFYDMTWKSVPCCTQLKPICYKKTDYFPL